MVVSSAAATTLPSDVSVHLTATPSAELVPGAPFMLNLEVANEGASTVSLVVIASSPLYPYEVDLSQGTIDCIGMHVSISDTPVGYFYTQSWHIGPDPSSPLEAGEHRVCHITMALAADAPPVVHLSFGMSELFSDPDPSNDIGTVTLRRAQVVEPVPAGSLPGAILLALGLGALGAWRRRIRRRADE